MDYHGKNGKFPGNYVTFPRRKSSLANWLFWSISITASFLYLISSLITNRNYITLTIILGFLGVVVQALKTLIKATRAHRGSAYGGSPNQSPKKEVKKLQELTADALSRQQSNGGDANCADKKTN